LEEEVYREDEEIRISVRRRRRGRRMRMIEKYCGNEIIALLHFALCVMGEYETQNVCRGSKHVRWSFAADS